ncbi:MAG: glutathione peroxidase [Myxococcota bacterium]|nr:glutathione peroxidase [Myxococcota bacterium]
MPRRRPRSRPRAAAAALAALLLAAAASPAGAEEPPASPLAFTLPRIDGTPQPLADYAGRVLLLVNVASRCGYTPQYEGLEALYERYRERGFAVLGFPANDFKGQEPGSNAEIAEFCRSTYGVRFPMFAKLHVRGPEQHPLYRLLTGLPEPVGGPVAWNFQKYLVDREGRVVARFEPATGPDDPELVAAIERLLETPAP